MTGKLVDAFLAVLVFRVRPGGKDCPLPVVYITVIGFCVYYTVITTAGAKSVSGNTGFNR